MPGLIDKIRNEATSLGFFKVGIVRSGPLPHRERFDAWLARKMHGEMVYLERQAERRRDPGLVLDQARTILVLAMNYHTEYELSEDPLRGRISRYAWGQDYHDILLDKLKRMEVYLRVEVPGIRTKCHVDTGPVMEKAWGAQSALGWMGKHTNLIIREQGSWLFLGVILLNIELDFDRLERDHCGTCTRCIAACPTGAIVAPYVLDARLCISYLTIELRGKIPRELRSSIGNRIYGCDDCQEVCPWNRFAVNSSDPGFQPRFGNLNPDLASLVGIMPEEFNRRFKGSPICRARRNGFVRNVVVALGNSRRPEAIEPLSRAVHDQSPLVRAHAVWALGRIGTPDVHELLAGIRASETDPSVIEEFE
jgi:epoxyqueuosine reductase